LRIIAKLDDVPMPVVSFQQMRLGASSHFSNVPDRREGHQREKL